MCLHSSVFLYFFELIKYLSKGFTTESLMDILHEVCKIATKVYNINTIVSKLKLTPSKIHQTLSFAVEEYLHFYEQCVLALPASIHAQYISLIEDPISMDIMELMIHMRKLQQSILFLEGNALFAVTDMDSVSLLQYLYSVVQRSVNDNQSLTKYLLQMCCQPFMDIINSWIFCGEFTDVNEEFSSRTKTANSVSVVFENIPDFLQYLRCDIERCGWSLNILQHCNLQLFQCCYVPNCLEEELMVSYHPIRVCFTVEELDVCRKQQRQLFLIQQSFFSEVCDEFQYCQQMKQNIKYKKQLSLYFIFHSFILCCVFSMDDIVILQKKFEIENDLEIVHQQRMKERQQKLKKILLVLHILYIFAHLHFIF